MDGWRAGGGGGFLWARCQDISRSREQELALLPATCSAPPEGLLRLLRVQSARVLPAPSRPVPVAPAHPAHLRGLAAPCLARNQHDLGGVQRPHNLLAVGGDGQRLTPRNHGL